MPESPVSPDKEARVAVIEDFFAHAFIHFGPNFFITPILDTSDLIRDVDDYNRVRQEDWERLFRHVDIYKRLVSQGVVRVGDYADPITAFAIHSVIRDVAQLALFSQDHNLNAGGRRPNQQNDTHDQLRIDLPVIDHERFKDGRYTYRDKLLDALTKSKPTGGYEGTYYYAFHDTNATDPNPPILSWRVYHYPHRDKAQVETIKPSKVLREMSRRIKSEGYIDPPIAVAIPATISPGELYRKIIETNKKLPRYIEIGIYKDVLVIDLHCSKKTLGTIFNATLQEGPHCPYIPIQDGEESINFFPIKKRTKRSGDRGYFVVMEGSREMIATVKTALLSLLG